MTFKTDYGEWWQSFLIAFSVATWSFGLPLYSYVVANDFFRAMPGQNVLVFMLAYHAAPLLVIFGLDRIVISRWRMGRVLRAYRGFIFAGTILVFLRAVYMDRDLPLDDVVNSLPMAAVLILTGAALVALPAAGVYIYRPATLYFLYMSTVSLILTVLFVAQVGLVSKFWTSDSPSPSPIAQDSAIDLAPIFIIVFDGLGGDVLLKGGRINEVLFPQFSELGEDSAVFTNATSNYIDTQISIQSMLTGAWLEDDEFVGATGLGSKTVGILSVLSDAGYSIAFFSNANNLITCEERSSFICREPISSVIGNNIHLIARDFWMRFIPRVISLAVRDFALGFFPDKVNTVIPFPSIHQYERPMWTEFVSSVSHLDSPGKVYFVHVLLPHHPYELDRNGNRVRTVPFGEGFEDLDKLTEDYRDQTVVTDTLLGELTERLKAEKLYRRSLVVVTSDHGPRSLGLGRKYAGIKNIQNYFPDELNQIIPSVPLIIHAPNVKPQISEFEYQHIDLAPTLIDVLSLPPTSRSRGVSVFASNHPKRDRVFYGFPASASGVEKITYVYDEDLGHWLKAENPMGVDGSYRERP